jgi:AcrR family transcriptional regulator
MAATRQAPLRKDAQRNREAILCAARELFAESADVPMYEVARRAGVGQATLYRNFPDRRVLAAELIAAQMQRGEELAAEHAGDPDAFFVLLREIAEAVGRFHGVSELARQDACVGSELERMRQRLAELMKAPLRDAKAAGTLRRDLTIDDLFLIMLMIRGAVDTAEGVAARASAASRALTLALDGIAASGTHG